MFCLIFASFLLAAVGGTNAEQCDKEEFTKRANAVGFRNGFFFEDINDSQEFKDNCPDRLEATKYVRKYAPLCYPPGYNEEDLNSSLKTVEDLCTEGTDLNLAYLENIDCLEKMEKDILFCNTMFAQSQNWINLDDSLEQHVKVTHSCCSFEWVKECRKRSAEVRCGEDAKSYIEMVTARQFVQLLVPCADYSPYHENCDELYGVDVGQPEELFSSESDTNAEQCDKEEFTKRSNAVGFKNGYFFEDVSDSREFKDNCPDRLEAAKYVRKYAPLCYPPGYNEEDLNSSLKTVEDLCTEGTDLNLAYLKNIDCLEKMEKDILFCNTMYFQSQNWINLDDSLEQHAKHTHSCCAFEWVKECRKRSAEVRCGEDAKSYIEMVTARQFAQLLVPCADYSPYHENCDELYGVDVGQPGSEFGGQPKSGVARGQSESGIAEGQPELFSSGSMLSASIVIPFLSLLFI